jgi:hypothetical protein
MYCLNCKAKFQFGVRTVLYALSHFLFLFIDKTSKQWIITNIWQRNIIQQEGHSIFRTCHNLIGLKHLYNDISILDPELILKINGSDKLW